MPHLVLSEAFRVVELDQVGHVGVAKRVQVQFFGKPSLLAGIVEGGSWYLTGQSGSVS